MKMEVRVGIVLAALSLSLFSYCCSAANLITSQDVLNGTVGGEITFNLSIDPVDQTAYSGTWTFGSENVVTWADLNMIYASDYRGRVELSPATGTLKFNRLFATDSGEYTVSITTAPSNLNLGGRVELKVYEPVSNVKITAKPDQPVENKNFSLTCDASGQVDSIHWVKNDQPVSPSGNITLSADSKTLSFNPVRQSDNGSYTCTASNPASKMSSEVYNLTVVYGPEQVSISGPSDNVTVGAEVKLTCSAVSQPPAIFTWYLKGKHIGEGTVYLNKSVQLNHAGSYICEAFNSVTEEKRSAKMELFVTGNPKNGGLSPGAIAGITIGVILFVAIIIALIVIFCCPEKIRTILGCKEEKDNQQTSSIKDSRERKPVQQFQKEQ